MLLWKQLENTIDEYITDKTMEVIWPQICEEDENAILRRVCDHQAHTADEIKKNVKNVCFEALGDLQRIASVLDGKYYNDVDDQSFIEEYPEIAKAVEHGYAYDLVDDMHHRILQMDDPIDVETFLDNFEK